MHGLTLGFAAAWVDSEYVEPQDIENYGTAPWGLIENQTSAFATYELQEGPLQGFGFGATLVDVGDRRQGDLFLKGYTRADLHLSYQGLPDWDITLQLRNVTDERYVERLRDRYQDNFFGAPRAFLLRTEYQF